MENAKTRGLQKCLPRVNHDNVYITIGVEDIFIAALVSLSRREAEVLHETLKSDNRFSEAAKAYISDSLPPPLALSDSESLSDSNSDQWQTWNCNNWSVLTKLLFNSFFQILKIVVVVVI